MPQERSYNDPSESLTGLRVPLEGATLLDFWKWAFCDLCDDDIKGIFAEWVVAKLLSHKGQRRISWADSDLILEDGTRIEVKASAFWQSWKLLDGSGKVRSSVDFVPDRKKIRFAGLKARNISSNQWAGEVLYKSDLYVFAFQKEEDISKWNAMDMAQWEFFVAAKEDLKSGSISLASLEAAKLGPLTADEMAANLAQKIDARIAAKSKQANSDESE